MNNKFNGKHLSLEDRKMIEEGIEKGFRKFEIAKSINKSPSTITKEIKKNRKLKPRNLYNTTDKCIHLKDCKVCISRCKDYEEQPCFRRDRFVGACNNCSNIKKCKLDKYFYKAKIANENYLYTLKDSREGVNLTYPELNNIARIITPLIEQGQSVYQILENHKEINMIGVLHSEKTANSMASSLDRFQDILDSNYSKLFSLLLTDRRTEFSKPQQFEINMETGEMRSNIFYCDPQTPSQKPHVENTHNFIRELLPNGMSWTRLTQDKVDLMFSHINSVPRNSLGGKTPYEAFSFFYGSEILEKFNIQKIAKDKVTLKPYLLKIK